MSAPAKTSLVGPASSPPTLRASAARVAGALGTSVGAWACYVALAEQIGQTPRLLAMSGHAKALPTWRALDGAALLRRAFSSRAPLIVLAGEWPALALPIVADLVEPHVSREYASELRRIQYLANICIVLELDRSLSETYWLNVNDPGFLINGHSGPIIYAPAFLPCVFRPSVVTELARMWDGVKAPALFSGVNVVGADVTGKCGQGFWQTAADNKEILVNHRGAGECDEAGCDIPPESFAKIDAPLITEGFYRLAGVGVQFVNKVHYADNDAPVFVIGADPIRETSIRLCAEDAGVKLPFHLSARGINSENFL